KIKADPIFPTTRRLRFVPQICLRDYDGASPTQVAMMSTKDNDAIHEPSLTVSGFCVAEDISPAMLYRIWQEGLGPDFYYIGNRRRITAEARRRWHAQREAEAAANPLSNNGQSVAGRASAARRKEQSYAE